MLKSSRKRLTFVITGLGRGGAEIQLLRLATGMKARGWDVSVITLVPPRGVASELEGAGVTVASLGIRQGVPDPRAPFRLARLLRRLRPEIVHSHMVHANLLARISQLLYQAPAVVCTAHSVKEGSFWLDLGIRLSDGLCDLTTGVSHAVADRYRRAGLAPNCKLRVVPNGVDTSGFRPSSEVRSRLRQTLDLDDQFVWLAVGRMRRVKNYPVLISAFARLRNTHPNARLVVVGDGPDRGECEALIAQRDLASQIILLGVRQDIPDVMNMADAFVLSSDWEGLPLVLQEASATGLPVVATDVGGVSDVIIDEQTGFLVPPRDPAALSSAMARLMDLPEEKRRCLGSRGRLHVESVFEMERVIETWDQLYRDLTSRAYISLDGRTRRTRRPSLSNGPDLPAGNDPG